MGTIRLRQKRFADAEAFLAQARAVNPENAQLNFSHGMALVGLGRDEEAARAYSEAIRLKPDFVDAQYALGSAFQRLGRWSEAERRFRELLAMAPDYVPAQLALGGVLIEMQRPAEAEAPLREALMKPAPPQLKAHLHVNLGLALRRQRKDEEALQNYDIAARMYPVLTDLNVHRAEALQNLGRHDEALAEYRKALAQDPANPHLHRFYNDLLYRLGQTEAYLKSYDALPQNRTLRLGKAPFLVHERRGAECLEIYRDLLARDPQDPVAARGVAESFLMLNRHDEARLAFEKLLAVHSRSPGLFVGAAKAAILSGDPQRALTWCGKALDLAPYDQNGLAMMSVCLRMLEDERDEGLNGYDSLIGVFDLEPPEGFASMEEFNAQLCAYLDRLHPETREYLHQSLRGGTQTPDHLFGAGHRLIDLLQQRIDETVRRYILELREDDRHPFLSRRSHGFRYAGSWSSRLRDNGFHVNHIHQEGWISSCYYAGVPEAVNDEKARQGWIKFGEPDFAVELANPIRRDVQPAPGRLVLFPSYLWHGTIPFHSAAPRTTIAFDVVPCPP